jgi:hypothetical protein
MLDDGSGSGSSLFEVLKSLMKSRRACMQPKDWIYGLLALPNDVKSSVLFQITVFPMKLSIPDSPERPLRTEI